MSFTDFHSRSIFLSNSLHGILGDHRSLPGGAKDKLGFGPRQDWVLYFVNNPAAVLFQPMLSLEVDSLLQRARQARSFVVHENWIIAS